MAAPSISVIRSRTRVLHHLVLLAFIALACRLIYLQGFRFPDLSAAAARLRAGGDLRSATRGQIYDCHGIPLAINADVESIFADPERIEDPEQVVATLAPILQLDPDRLASKIKDGKRFVWLRRKVKPEIAAKVKALQIEGVGTRLERKRIYPSEGSLLANVLGFVGTDNDGLEGLERQWDALLAGDAGVAAHDSAPSGSLRPPPSALELAHSGRHLVLTIDARVQQIAAEQLRLQCLSLKPKSATLTVLDPRTGDVLAMCSYPSFDPNHFDKARPQEWRNRPVSWTFEPGSILKPVLIASALDAGVVGLDDTFNCPGEITVAGKPLGCWGEWRRKGHGTQTIAKILANSCNIGAARIALRLGKHSYRDYLTDFGFGVRTGIDCPGEEPGRLPPIDEWGQRLTATAGFGQGVAVTPLQLACAAAALVNGGTLPYPRIVREVRDDDGSVFRAIEPRMIRRVVTPQTSATICDLLVGVVENGTGKGARIPGYRIGGKTGTAQKTEPGVPGYLLNRFVVSFWGAAPLPDPQFVVVVTLEEPRGEQSGSAAAAPVFKAVTKRLLKYYRIPPEEAAAPNAKPDSAAASGPSARKAVSGIIAQ